MSRGRSPFRRASLAAALATVLLAGAPRAEAPTVEERLREAARALQAWDVARAARLAEALRLEHPSEPEIATLLGRIRLDQGRYEEAAALLEEAGARDDAGSPRQVARDTARLMAGYQTVESANFVFAFPPGKDEVLAPYALDALESARTRIGALVGYVPPDRIRVEVVQDARELALVSTLSHEAIKTTGTIAICKFDKLMITSPKALVRGYDWLDTLAHEYVHLVVSRHTGNRTPIWLHEGIAKFLETAWRGEPGRALELSSQTLLREAVKADQLITFEQMHPSIALLPSAKDAALAFAEVFAAIEFLHAKDPRSIARVLSELARGAPDREAVAAVFGAPFPRFEQAWRQHLRTRPYPKETAGLERLELRFHEDERADEERSKSLDATERGEFGSIEDGAARKLAHLGELLRARGKTAAAAAKYRQALDRVGARYPDLSNKYALSMIELNALDKAEAELTRSLQLFPTEPFTHLNLARLAMLGGRPGDALPHLFSSIAVNPFDPELHLRLQEVATAQGDTQLAARAARAVSLLKGRPVGSLADSGYDARDAALTSPEAARAAPVVAADTEGGLRISSDVPAFVFVDGSDTGLTTPIVRLPLPPGERVVRLVSLDGAHAQEYPVTIRPGETATLEATLEPR